MVLWIQIINYFLSPDSDEVKSQKCPKRITSESLSTVL